MSSSMPRWFVVALCNDIKMYSSNDLHYLVEFFFFFLSEESILKVQWSGKKKVMSPKKKVN